MTAFTTLGAFICQYKHNCLLILSLFILFNIYSQNINSTKDKFYPCVIHTWYKAHSLSKTDPGYGDTKCVFSKKESKFRFYKFSEKGIWKKKTVLAWKIMKDFDSVFTLRIILTIGINPAPFLFREEQKNVFAFKIERLKE